MVLENNLAEELCNFKDKKECDNKTIERILYYYKQYVLLQKEYMKRYYGAAALSLILGGNTSLRYNDNLKCLSNNTIYKIILSKDKDTFPYVNIFKDKIENNLSASFFKSEDRKKAKEHLKALLDNAEDLFIYDKFINKNQKKFIEFAKECFPEKPLNILFLSSNKFSQELCTELKKINQKWEIKENKYSTINNKYSGLHDRYIIIDNKIQIILTSGIDNLINTKKDFTYIIKEIEYQL
ncbi:hypothetical protein [Campylobacter cuniculorum]|nr:hypothetical protein [Campylobacter cuniculorum]